MRLLLTLILITVICTGSFAQTRNDTAHEKQTGGYSYAYITVEGKAFSKKLKVAVDFGDTPEQLAEGKACSEILTNKKSYAAVLNYMAEHDYELVASRDNTSSIGGTGGTEGVVFIMRRKK
jgi:hypothetical protein